MLLSGLYLLVGCSVFLTKLRFGDCRAARSGSASSATGSLAIGLWLLLGTVVLTRQSMLSATSLVKWSDLTYKAEHNVIVRLEAVCEESGAIGADNDGVDHLQGITVRKDVSLMAVSRLSNYQHILLF